MIGEEGHGTGGVGDVKVGQAAAQTILQNGAEPHRSAQGRQQEVPDVETIRLERRRRPASGAPCLGGRHDEARVAVGLDQVAESPRRFTGAPRPFNLVLLRGRLLEAKTQAEWPLVNHRHRPAPLPTPLTERDKLFLISIDPGFGAAQGRQPAVVHGVKRGCPGPTLGSPPRSCRRHGRCLRCRGRAHEAVQGGVKESTQHRGPAGVWRSRAWAGRPAGVGHGVR